MYSFQNGTPLLIIFWCYEVAVKVLHKITLTLSIFLLKKREYPPPLCNKLTNQPTSVPLTCEGNGGEEAACLPRCRCLPAETSPRFHPWGLFPLKALRGWFAYSPAAHTRAPRRVASLFPVPVVPSFFTRKRFDFFPPFRPTAFT